MPITEHNINRFLTLLPKGIFLSAFFLFLFLQNVLAQPITENKLIAEEYSPSVETKSVSLEIVYERDLKANIENNSFENYDLKKLNLNKKNNIYTPSQIDRSFSVNNPFDMEDLSNPFNLQRPGSKNRFIAKEKESPNFQKFFNTLFEYKEAAKKTVVNKKPELVAPYWILFSLLLMLITFAYQIVSFKAENRKAFQAYSSSTSALQQYRDKKSSIGLYDLVSNLLFVLSSGHFIFVAMNLWHHNKELEPDWNFSSLLFTFFGVAAIYSAKHLKMIGLGLFFPFKQQLNYYSYIISNGNRVMGLLLTPLMFFMVYSPEVVKFLALYAGAVLLSGNFLYRYFRTAVASSDLILENKFHFFIYLCAVELAPVLILLKLLSVI